MEIRNCLPEETPGEREILELAMDAGTVLLENDAEIFRAWKRPWRVSAAITGWKARNCLY